MDNLVDFVKYKAWKLFLEYSEDLNSEFSGFDLGTLEPLNPRKIIIVDFINQEKVEVHKF